VVTAEGERESEIPGYYRTVLTLLVNEVPSMGYTALIVQEKDESMQQIEETKETIIQNSLLKLSFAHGKLALENVRTNEKMENFIRFENAADAGDSYDFSPLPGDQPIYIHDAVLVSVKHGSIVQKMKVNYSAVLPKDLKARKVGEHAAVLQVETTFELREGEEFIRIRHEIDNRCKDHRVRVLLSTGVENIKHSYADQAFSLIKRPVVNRYLQNWREEKFAEAPVPIYPLENLVAVTDGQITFAAITKGIKEYEVLPGTNEIALTLFRSVGLLGRDDLLWRPGRASGINNKVVYTPDAQLQKKLSFDYAVTLGNGPLDPAKLFAVTDSYCDHYATYQNQSLNTFEERLDRFELPLPVDSLPAQHSLFEIDNENVFMSVCKQSYELDGVIVRLFNPTDVCQKFTVSTSVFSKQTMTNLYEAEEKSIYGPAAIEPFGYVTIKLT